MRAIEIIGRLRERYSNKYTKSPKNNKEHYINWLQDEYAELAIKQANGVFTGEGQSNIPDVSNSLLDLDGKTIPVTFHVSKYKHKIVIDFEQ